MKGTTVERCVDCTGYWFDPGALSLSIEVVKRLDTDSGSWSPLGCVRCSEQNLVDVVFPDTKISILACPVCKSAWLDKGKLDELKAALRTIVGEPGKSPSGDRMKELLGELQQAYEGTRCPRCKERLEPFTRKGMILDRCRACAGLWYDDGELTADLGLSRRLRAKEGTPSDLRCPRCPDRGLFSIAYPKTPVMIDACADCNGVWLDETRLAELRNALGLGA